MDRIDFSRWKSGYFVKETRCYRLNLEQDLWSPWVVIRCFGSRGYRGGRMMREYFGTYQEGLDRLQYLIEFRQKRRKYQLVESKNLDYPR